MSEHTNGLRFDVYERVHLPDDVAAIDELEEIELVPRIQVIDQGDHAVLKGTLLLSGVYRGQNAAEAPLTLEHWIPVEITLPMNRISRLDDISIDIDNFDVDLLSARTLNITGVLSLRGISMDPVEEPEHAWREEPITVVHEREPSDQQAGPSVQAERPDEFEPFVQSGQVESFESFQPFGQEAQPYISDSLFSGFAAEQAETDFAQQIAEQREPEAKVSISSSSSEPGWSSSQMFASNGQQPPPEEIRDITLASQQASEDSWLASLSQYPGGQSAAQPQQDGSVQEQEQERQDELERAEEEAAFAEAYALLALEEQAQRELEAEMTAERDFVPQQHEAAPAVPAKQEPRELEAEMTAERDFVPQQPETAPDVPAKQAQRELEAEMTAERDFVLQQPEAAPEEPVKQEPRIAFAGKRPEEPQGQAANVGIMTLLQTSRREQAAREAAEQIVAKQIADEARAQSTGDEIEWKNLFLGRNAEENEFRKIRVCIVQRDETLETIALRYSLNPRELLVRNNLNESAVKEGQLLYIP